MSAAHLVESVYQHCIGTRNAVALVVCVDLRRVCEWPSR